MAKMFVTERRNKILEYLSIKKRATVKELSEKLSVSEATLRSDLNDMEKEGLLVRTHGGAVLHDYIKPELNFSTREKQNHSEKVIIGQLAEKLIEGDQCILLDASSTVLELAKILKHKPMRLTVLTNGIYTALELRDNPEITVIMLGGIVRMGSSSIEGTLGANILNNINVDIMFTSAHGFTFENGLMDFNIYEVELKKAMVESSNRVVALLDHSKFGKNSIATFCDIEKIDTIITDRPPTEEFIKELKQKNIHLVY
ncbi:MULTISPECIES: DeoR/GlpR family DNA-binding transcription regulator [Parageobacillus]|uniref:Transcriptional regulator, DeoR family n=2 Tax=Anoxybacillaceae TaxID=3120669 RepID=A0A1I0SPB9_9BACL|nr:transcriptional regulator, DeoR family [Parageobacillus thermantarcticus]